MHHVSCSAREYEVARSHLHDRRGKGFDCIGKTCPQPSTFLTTHRLGASHPVRCNSAQACNEQVEDVSDPATRADLGRTRTGVAEEKVPESGSRPAAQRQSHLLERTALVLKHTSSDQ